MDQPTTPAQIRTEYPLLADNEGVWEGIYRYYDAASGKLMDQHVSRLICRLTDDPRYTYHQTNYYFWPDGRTDIREFPAWYEKGRIWWDNDLIKGWAAPMLPDDFSRSTCLNWTRKGEEDLYLYEMIQNSTDRTLRARVWQWFRNDKCYLRTLIDEKFITRDWQNWDRYVGAQNSTGIESAFNEGASASSDPASMKAHPLIMIGGSGGRLNSPILLNRFETSTYRPQA